MLNGRDAFTRVGDDWDRLWQVTEPPAPMLEGAWVRRWLTHHAGRIEPLVAVLRDDSGAACAVAPLYRRGGFDRLSKGLRTVSLLGMGEHEDDEVFGEYHTWLGAPDARDALSEKLSAWLAADRGWDRLQLPNLSPESMIAENLLGRLDGHTTAVNIHRFPSFRSPALPLEAYLAALPSPKLRHKLRRSLKEADARGLRFERATSLEQARRMLGEIAALHQRQWEARGKRGVFASPVFRSFHEDLLSYYSRNNRLWVVGLRKGGALCAGRYLIEARGRLYDYISGMEGTDDNLLNPGLVMHVLTIDAAAAAGIGIYDFMGGDYDYKRRLAASETEQISIDAFRSNARSLCWLSARALRRRFRDRGNVASPRSA